MARGKSVQVAVSGSQKKEILLGVAAVITAVAAFLTAVIGPKGVFDGLAEVMAVTPTAISEPTAVPAVTPANCHFFDDIEDDYVVTVDLGSEVSWQMSVTHTDDHVIAIRLLDSDSFAFMGGVKLFYLESRDVFEVVTAVNGRCEALLDFEKEYTVKNGEVFPLVIGEQEYVLQFAVFAGEILIHFTKQPPLS